MELEIEALMDEGLQEGLAGPKQLGRVVRGWTRPRLATSRSSRPPCRARCRLAGLRVVIDCANGAAYKVAPTVLYELGAEVKEVGVSPNGLNINAECGSTYPARPWPRRCSEYRADIGIALDGDADRAGDVRRKGRGD